MPKQWQMGQMAPRDVLARVLGLLAASTHRAFAVVGRPLLLLAQRLVLVHLQQA